MSQYIQDIVYDSGGHTGNVYYARFVVNGGDPRIGYAWDDVNEELAQSPDWADTVVALVEIGTTGEFPMAIPDELPTGILYDIIVYQQSGSVPDSQDNVETQYKHSVGSIFGF